MMTMKMKITKNEASTEYNLISFKEKFIVTGPRNNVINILKILRNYSLQDTSLAAKQLLASHSSKIVLYCSNSSNGYPEIRVLTRSWWDAWHNPKNTFNGKKSSVKTFNAYSQKSEILNMFNLKEIELLIPE